MEQHVAFVRLRLSLPCCAGAQAVLTAGDGGYPLSRIQAAQCPLCAKVYQVEFSVSLKVDPK